jgi:hypothetical protein
MMASHKLPKGVGPKRWQKILDFVNDHFNQDQPVYNCEIRSFVHGMTRREAALCMAIIVEEQPERWCPTDTISPRARWITHEIMDNLFNQVAQWQRWHAGDQRNPFDTY